MPGEDSFPFDFSTVLTGGVSALAVLFSFIMANFAGRWFSKAAVDKLIQAYKDIIGGKDAYIKVLEADRDFYRSLVVQVADNQVRMVDSQEKIVNIVDRQAKPNGTTN